MTKFMKGTAIALSVIFAAYFFSIDSLVKTQLERRATEILQTRVDIGSVSFHLVPTTLTLRDVRIANAHLPTHNLAQAEELSLPLSLRDLFAHEIIVDTLDIHGLRFNRPRNSDTPSASPASSSATKSLQLHEALQRVQQMLNHPLASNTIDPNASLSSALLADQFKPLLTQIATALNMLAAPDGELGDWRMLARHVNIDGALDFGSNALRFTGAIDNVTPQPKLFDAVTQLDLRSADGEPATLRATGRIDKRKIAQLALRFDLDNFSLAQWPLSTDPELKIVVVDAQADVHAIASLTGNQFDLNVLAQFRAARFDVADSGSDIAHALADVWRRTDAFDIHLQASGEATNPALKMNSSLDIPLANAIQQLRSASTFPPATAFPTAP